MPCRKRGTLLIGEYSSVPESSRDDPITRVFVNRRHSPSRTETGVSGILRQGNYPYLQNLLPYGIDIADDSNGMIDLRHCLTGLNPHKKEIGVYLLKRILKQAGITREEWKCLN